MKCIRHPKTPLEAQEIAFRDFNGNSRVQYKDVFYCPDCWKDHEKGNSIKHDIVHDDFISKIQPEEFFDMENEIEEVIELQIRERKDL
jgi:hypothetical protein